MTHGTDSSQLQQLTRELLERYERGFNDGLQGQPDIAAVADLYAAAFVAASPAGVFSGKNDDELKKVTAQGFEHYRKTGVQEMKVAHLDVSAIDDLHGLARVGWRAVYEVDGARKPIDFTNVYLVRIEGTQARVFGWITGDEQAVLRKHGIG